MALLGFLTISVFLIFIFTRKVSVIVALVMVPVIFGLIGGFGLELGEMMLSGLSTVAPTGIMLVFAILYFSLMLDVGLFDPMIKFILKVVKGDPLKVVVGTAILAMVVHLDGNGSATFIITISAMLPIYKKLGINRLVLAGVVALGAGVMNIVPWGGPTARAMTTLGAEAKDIFNPVIPAMIAGIVWVIIASALIGLKERKRLGILQLDESDLQFSVSEEEQKLRKPKLFIYNLLLTIALLVSLVGAWLPMPILFVLAFVAALMVNYPKHDDQQARIAAHSKSVLLVATMIFAAGIFTGILNGTGMIEDMALALVNIIPDSMGRFLPVIVAITSMPLSLVFTPDAYYFGVLPVIAETASTLGINPHEIGRAAILGHMTVGFPLSPLTASTFILIGLAQVDLVDHQKFIFKWAFMTTVVMTIVAVLIGAISI
ncbi:CitMHS family transporter [Solibacillus sp. FSL K6-4121]|uniref:CitMHS family transporter n=1 Tax=Solibacillus sp. FSL K6-4121 TaxID=2921505 RepID=UPI0030FB93A1